LAFTARAERSFGRTEARTPDLMLSRVQVGTARHRAFPPTGSTFAVPAAAVPAVVRATAAITMHLFIVPPSESGLKSRMGRLIVHPAVTRRPPASIGSPVSRAPRAAVVLGRPPGRGRGALKPPPVSQSTGPTWATEVGQD